jgi:predicted dehydrogenase
MELIVVGAGWAGERHVEAIRSLERTGADYHVAALVDVDRAHLAAQADAWGIDVTYPDLATALEDLDNADAVVLATPHHLHREGAERAAGAGKHVLVEKPIALTLDDADRMIRACERAGVTLMVAESARYSRTALVIRDLLASERIGTILSGRLNRITKGKHTYAYPGRRAWLADPDVCGGGIWMLNGIHALSLARMLLGEPARIYAREVHSEHFQSSLEATIVALLSFASGAEVTMTVSAELHGYRRYGDLVLFGTDGTLCVRRPGGTGVIVDTAEGTEYLPCAEDDCDGARGSFVRQMQEFAAAATEGREPASSGRSERKTLAAILAGYESVRTGRPVELDAAR